MKDSARPAWERIRPDRVIGARVYAFGEVDSTMDVAWGYADQAAPHGTAVRAAAQRMGRGRFSRRWVSGHGESLLTSVVLRHPPIKPGALITVAASLAVAETVDAIANTQCQVKWPNDVLVGAKKVAGILVESRIAGESDFIAVLGIGLNVNTSFASDPELAETATSIREASGVAADLDEVEDLLFERLETTLEQTSSPERLVQRWKERLTMLGSEVTVHRRDGALTGMAVDVDSHGHLLLRTPDRMVHSLAEGDVTFQG